MKTLARITLVAAICFSAIGCDQATKKIAAEHLPRGEMHTFFNDVLRIGYTENTGAFLGMGSAWAPDVRFWVFVVAVGVFLLGMLGYLLVASKQSALGVAGLSLLFSGGLSNFLDRLYNNAVVDFMNMGVGSLRTGVFNVADMAIMLGGLLWILSQRQSHKAAG